MKKQNKTKGGKKLKGLCKRIYDTCGVKAKKIMPDRKKISKKIRKARKIIEKLHNLPRFEALSTNICNVCDLLSDYLDGLYTKLPSATIVALIGGLLYVILPIDALADFVPILGWLDDAMVIAFVIDAEQNDVNEYLEWKAIDENDKESLS